MTKDKEYYRPYLFTLNTKQSGHIDTRVYEDKKLPDEKKEFPRGHRSEYVRKMINKDMKNDT